MNFIPFALPDIDESDIEEVVATLRSGWVTTGPKTHQFESEFKAYLGDDTLSCIAINSATAGLHLALEAIGVKPGDQVIVPTLTFTATAEVARYLGADLVFVDVEPDTLCIDISAVEKAITSKTKAVIAVHFGGRAADITSLIQLCRPRGIHIVEDAAHALPTTHLGHIVGTLNSDCTVFSFYANKTMTTGEGGMLVTRSKDIAQRAKIMRLHGISRDAFDRFTSKKPAWYYEVVEPGFKYNLTDIASALGLSQLNRVNKMMEVRKSIANYYDRSLDLDQVKVYSITDEIHSYHLYPITIQGIDEGKRNSLIDRIHNLGIGLSVHYIPLHLHPYWKNRYNLRPEHFPVAQSYYERSFSLPIYSKLTIEQADYIVKSVNSVLKT